MNWEVTEENYAEVRKLYFEIRGLHVCGAFLDVKKKRDFLRDKLGIEEIGIWCRRSYDKNDLRADYVGEIDIAYATQTDINDVIIFAETQIGMSLIKYGTQRKKPSSNNPQGAFAFGDLAVIVDSSVTDPVQLEHRHKWS